MFYIPRETIRIIARPLIRFSIIILNTLSYVFNYYDYHIEKINRSCFKNKIENIFIKENFINLAHRDALVRFEIRHWYKQRKLN